ncbi:hypothetical protein Acor_60460 [Acrocarpospora corrugata]|uniref:CopC domain-containing protein n=1 Tax=Acrocarpospora corrugata TaxID=35763 RepID=A0A5M3W6S4_9ACTN|nr:hypothetical protein [Acrocarpospora corrugata]GES03980.1 hypothetical protein Acor_60460 [Acrocarpospora corrugata]
MNKALRYAAIILLAGLGLLLGAPAASAAADGPIQLEVVGDGGRNVNVLVTWKKDGSPVTDLVAATLLATAPDGRTFGPITLKSAPEGQNLYNAAEPLPAGEWKVTVTATKPAKASKSVTLASQDIALPAPVAPVSDAALTERVQESSSDLPLTLGVIGVGVVAALAILLVLVRRRNVA